MSTAMSQINEAGIRYDQLVKYPEAQAETILRHYAAHAKIAMDTLQILNASRCAPDKKVTDELINYAVQQIKNNHIADFGIPLEWKD